LHLAKSETFDLLLCDIGLPDGDGCDLMRELHALYKLEGVAVTGYGMAHDVERCLGAGFNSHVLKPISFDKLLTTLEQALKVRRQSA